MNYDLNIIILIYFTNKNHSSYLHIMTDSELLNHLKCVLINADICNNDCLNK